MWRLATASDDEAIVSMCMELNTEDPGPNPVQPQQVRLTLAKLREEPNRGPWYVMSSVVQWVTPC
jgi:hypothetical protein